MKTLHYRRHSLKDGAVKDTIGPKGLDLARAQGKAVDLGIVGEVTGIGLMTFADRRKFARLFHGPLVRTAQTALAFCEGLGYLPTIMPVVDEIGTDMLFGAMVNDVFKAAVKDGASNLDALCMAHPAAAVEGMARAALEGVNKMFDQVNEGEVAVAFGHSPVIELAAKDVRGFPEGWDQLKEMDGLVFILTDIDAIIGKVIQVTEVTRAQRETARA